MASPRITTLEAAVSLLNSSSVDQRARGVAMIANGEFAPPDSIKHLDAMLAALKHPLTVSNVSARHHLLAAFPWLLQRVGLSLRSSLDRVVPHVAACLVDPDAHVRALAVATFRELLTSVRPVAAVGAMLAPSALGRSVRVREATLALLTDALRTPPPPADEVAAALCKRHLPTLLRAAEDGASASGAAALALIHALYLVPSAGAELRAGLTAAAAGLPRAILRAALQRLDDVDRGVAPELPAPYAEAAGRPKTPAAPHSRPATAPQPQPKTPAAPLWQPPSTVPPPPPPSVAARPPPPPPLVPPSPDFSATPRGHEYTPHAAPPSARKSLTDGDAEVPPSPLVCATADELSREVRARSREI